MSDPKSNQSRIKVIGFDLDNTLYPSTPEMQERIRKKIYEKLSAAIGVPFEKARDLFEENYNGNFAWSHSGSRTLEEIGKNYGKAINRDIVQESLEEADIVDLIKPNPDLREMMKRLGERFYLDLITGSRRPLAMEKLDRIGINPGVFGYLFFSDDSLGKSNGSYYRHWLAERKISPENALYVGDNKKQDVEVPKSLGIRTCFLGKNNPDADFCISNILDLERVV